MVCNLFVSSCILPVTSRFLHHELLIKSYAMPLGLKEKVIILLNKDVLDWGIGPHNNSQGEQGSTSAAIPVPLALTCS